MKKMLLLVAFCFGSSLFAESRFAVKNETSKILVFKFKYLGESLIGCKSKTRHIKPGAFKKIRNPFCYLRSVKYRASGTDKWHKVKRRSGDISFFPSAALAVVEYKDGTFEDALGQGISTKSEAESLAKELMDNAVRRGKGIRTGQIQITRKDLENYFNLPPG